LQYGMEEGVDVIPEGLLSLREALGVFRKWLWNGLDIDKELQRVGFLVEQPLRESESRRQQFEAVLHQELQDLIDIFQTGALDALVRISRVADGFIRIPPNEWSLAFFPERLFLADEIGEGHGAYFDALIGRTPLVRAELLDTYIESQHSQRLELQSVRSLKKLISSASGGAFIDADALHSFETAALDPERPSGGKAPDVPTRETRSQAAVRALRTLYGTRIPIGKKDVQILHEINVHLDAELEKIVITKTTLRRALKAAGFGRTRP
jgi:hypothetical protein